jgi:transposase InsO family protein
VLTENGSQFTDRFTSKKKDPETGDRIPNGKHAFDVSCKQLVIKHRLIPPRHPQTNGIVERFNGRMSEVVNQIRFVSRAELESVLRNYLNVYSHSIPQRALNNETPIQAMKNWAAAKKSELFDKRVYNQAGLDIYGSC